MSLETPVLIVGAGPVGLATALDLAYHGTRSVVIERDAGTALVVLAKAGTLNERTLEICRRWGIADRVANSGFPDDYPRDVVYCTSLSGFFMGRDKVPSTQDRGLPSAGPEMLRKCPQHIFDPLLAEACLETGMVDIQYNTQFDELTQDENGVTAHCTIVDTGEKIEIRSSYMVACDGGASKVRQCLDIPFNGERLDNSVSAMIRIPELWKYHDMGKAERYLFIGEEGTWGNLTAVDGRELYRHTIVGSADKLDVDKIDMEAEVRKGLGRDDIPFEIVSIIPWWRAQMAADRFRDGRVLLTGDSAHTTSPTGGHGLNTGIGDVSDAGWMLNALLEGWGGEGLLEAYHDERRPIAIRNSSASTRNYKVWVEMKRDKVLEASPEGDKQRQQIYEDMSPKLKQEWFSQGVGMGYRYEGSPIIVPDGTPPTPDDPTEYIQTSRPGHRAPHAWLEEGRSTLDLFGHGFTLLRFDSGAVTDGFESAAKNVGMPLSIVDISDRNIAELYERKLVLVRPDGMVAWRDDEMPKDPAMIIDVVRGA